MIEAHYNAAEWNSLQPWQRAEAVAHYRLRKHIALQQADALDAHLKRTRKSK